MTGEQLATYRARLGLTQESLVELLGCSLIGYKRFETDARPIPPYIAHAILALVVIANHGLAPEFKKLLKNA